MVETTKTKAPKAAKAVLATVVVSVKAPAGTKVSHINTLMARLLEDGTMLLRTSIRPEDETMSKLLDASRISRPKAEIKEGKEVKEVKEGKDSQ